MTVEFAEQNYAVEGNDRGTVQLFLENDIEDDLDVKAAARATDRDEGLVRVIDGWHDDDQGKHLTVEVWIRGSHLYTAHVYRKGQITAYS